MPICRKPATILACLLPVFVFTISAAGDQNHSNLQHVLLISIDGLHALDVARFVDSHPNSALAQLSRHAGRVRSTRRK